MAISILPCYCVQFKKDMRIQLWSKNLRETDQKDQMNIMQKVLLQQNNFRKPTKMGMSAASSKAYISKKKIDFLEQNKDASDIAPEEEDKGYYSNVEVSDEDLDNFAPVQDSKEKPPPVTGKEEVKASAKKKRKGRRHKQEIDTNVISVKAENLGDQIVYATGDPFYCSNCKAIFNSFSQPVAEKWKCEFCGQENLLDLEKEEYPKSNYVTYLLEAKAPVKDGENIEHISSDISVVFCVDLSGSMDATQFYKGEKLKYMNAAHYITRLQCVKIAIDSQLTKMVNSPSTQNYKVGFVTFEEGVALLGDKTVPPKVYKEHVLSNFSTLLEDGIVQAPKYLSKPLKDSYPHLLDTLKSLRTGGATALGPALLISVALATQGKPGSKVVICTDGLANRGLGSLGAGQEEKAGEFYNQVAEYAKSKGVTISVVTLVESGCRLDILSPIANLTGGDILRVNPMNLANDFETVLNEQVIATNVSVKAILHKALRFRNENEKHLSSDKTTLHRDIGNATKDTAITFEYSVKPPKELLVMKDVDLSKISKVPLQAQIIYTNTAGKKCMRVLTQVQEVTHKKEEAVKNANKQVLGAHVAIKSAEIADKGEFRQAQANAFHYAKMMGEDEEIREKVAPLYQALEKEHLENEEKGVAAPKMKSDRLAEAINKAQRQKKQFGL
eukprot:TRINITY_DN244_c0_g2_i1.p1 TRINITY_DN244_c0_g2~~TRINITY_DN244_c0_g2_i1.p1  ORF type:complete len:670 (+),score=77.61 TRINITY_DN244_c0_g2_i1:945-2954(+)